MGKYNYRRFVRRHLDRVEFMLNKEGTKLIAIAEQYETDHPEIATPLYAAGAGVATIISVIEHVRTLI